MRQGFTLVEVAIVLMIIGLIVGGVLTGRDLIKVAEIRTAITQIEDYNAAATTFRTKYKNLPGDITSQRATTFGFAARSGIRGHGDGNAIVEGCAAYEAALGCETALFWIDLSVAQLIDGQYAIGTSISTGDSLGASLGSADALSSYIPNLPFRDTALVHIFALFDRSYFLIGNFITDASGDPQLQSQGGLSPVEANLMDQKVDNGLPSTGIFRAVTSLDASGNGTSIDAGGNPAVAGDCVNAALSPPKYNMLTEEFATDLACHVEYRASF